LATIEVVFLARTILVRRGTIELICVGEPAPWNG
jgi:hypothetical protein